MYISCE